MNLDMMLSHKKKLGARKIGFEIKNDFNTNALEGSFF